MGAAKDTKGRSCVTRMWAHQHAYRSLWFRAFHPFSNAEPIAHTWGVHLRALTSVSLASSAPASPRTPPASPRTPPDLPRTAPVAGVFRSALAAAGLCCWLAAAGLATEPASLSHSENRLARAGSKKSIVNLSDFPWTSSPYTQASMLQKKRV